MSQAGTLVVDIETVGQGVETFSDRAREILLQSGGEKKPEPRDEIEDWRREHNVSQPAWDALQNLLDRKQKKEDDDRQKVVDSFGLDPCTGRIICIGVHWIELDRSRVYCQDDELELLANFWSDMGQIRPQRFITFNGKSFDFPYINVRSAILTVPVPRDVLLDTRRYSTDRHFDVREVLTNYDRYKKGTLEFFCEIFGVPSPKSEITGKNVGEYYKAGKIEDIARYCLADCKATGALYSRLKAFYR